MLHKALYPCNSNGRHLGLNGKPGNMRHNGWDAMLSAVVYAAAEQAQVCFPCKPILPECIRIRIGRMDIVDRKPKLSGKCRLALLLILIFIPPPERYRIKSCFLNQL